LQRELRTGQDFNHTGGLFAYTGSDGIITLTGNGSTPGTLNINGSSVLGNLKVDHASGITLTNDITVNSNLTLKNGAITLGTKKTDHRQRGHHNS
jgi:hypothetical protein